MESERAKRLLARRDVLKLVRFNVAGITVCVAVSLAFNAALFRHELPECFAKAMVSAVALPLVLGVPLLLYVSLQLRQLLGLNSELRISADQDSLTRLFNRGAFAGNVTRKLNEMSALDMARGALLIIDADSFKLINDEWGHSVGDDALRRLAAAFSRTLQEGDLIGRLGGEEFGVFLCGSSSTSARAVAERLRKIARTIDLRGNNDEKVSVSVSIGGVHFRQTLPFDTLYQLADRKLYEAKANGRDRVEFEDLPVETMLAATAAA